MDYDRIILGIDPGTVILGYGLIGIKGKEISLITLGVLKLSKYEGHPLRLKKIFERVLNLAEEYKPDELAIEAPFYAKNVQSMLKLGRAQGVAMAAALYRNIPITEYSPREIKRSVTGNGNASKDQVAGMLGNLIKLPEIPEYFDATDGLAVAVCHYFNNQKVSSTKSYNSWKNFLSENPDRIKNPKK
ncbi:MAG: crossover junction endodeoxyribonuclease RuvC [Bacteroidales bacterium]|nr:crossover junction endodeoxyribonuclease RuvC [Bacteroidales bacterium]